ncbi:hypothetical protein AAG570_001655 [Ranatra chinensis]|uniref:Uncharacterized protein n=1 Tax=Ranatra chinensis TaxID=642074 RepID=A0ABD0Y959_9HEMI
MESLQDFGRQKKRRKKRKKRKGETVGEGPMHFGDTVDDELKAQVLRSKTRTPSIAKPPEPNYIMPVTLNVDSMQRLYYETSLIEKVQMVRVFKDSKKFVDMKLKYPVHEVMENFNKFQTENLNKGLGRDEMTTFVEKNFEDFEELVVSIFQFS